MTREQNITNIATAINDKCKSGKKKFTIIVQDDLLGVPCMAHVTIQSADITSFAQYKNNVLSIRYKEKGRKNFMELLIYGSKAIAVFNDWQEITWERPRSWSAFDKNLFYSAVDSMRKEWKLGEESERVHLSEIDSIGKVYQIVTEAGTVLLNSEEELLEQYEIKGRTASSILRRELQNVPQLKGFAGPMYNGKDDVGRACIRYESWGVYDLLSR